MLREERDKRLDSGGTSNNYSVNQYRKPSRGLDTHNPQFLEANCFLYELQQRLIMLVSICRVAMKPDRGFCLVSAIVLGRPTGDLGLIRAAQALPGLPLPHHRLRLAQDID